MIVQRKRIRDRKGLASVVVMVVLVVLTLMSGVIIRQGLARREQLRARARGIQAEYLADSGLCRAMVKLNADPEYGGETWEIPAASLGRSTGDSSGDASDGLVTITVETPKDRTKQRVIKVQADYPRDPQLRARQSRRAVVEVDPQSNTTGGEKK